jgi:hypothetical protein
MGSKKKPNLDSHLFTGKDHVFGAAHRTSWPECRQDVGSNGLTMLQKKKRHFFKESLGCPRDATALQQALASFPKVGYAKLQTCAIDEHLSLWPT